jgi:hypothetical protein
MTCPELTDLLVDHAGGELTREQAGVVEQHVRDCPQCQAKLTHLRSTRTQLEQLRDDHYQPQLSGRIMKAIERRRSLSALGRAATLAIRGAAVAALLLLAVLAVRLQVWSSAPLQVPDAAYLLTGELIMKADWSEALIQVVGRGNETTRLVHGAGQVGYVVEGSLVLVDPGTDALRSVGGAPGLPVGFSPDGGVLWLLEDRGAGLIGMASLDSKTGQLTRASNALAGEELFGAAVSNDGRHIFLVARLQGFTYLKVLNTRTLLLETSIRLEEWEGGGIPFESPDKERLILVTEGQFTVVSLFRELDAPMAIGDVKRWSVPGLSRTVVLSPDGASLLAARLEGGIMEIDVATGKVRRRIPGPVYTHLALTGDGRFVVAATEGTVALLKIPRLRTQSELTLPSGEQVRALIAR